MPRGGYISTGTIIDHNELSYVPDCRSYHNLDVHHIVHRENGGTNELENLIVLCEGHHLALHEGALLIEGTASTAKLERRPNHKLKIETRVVATRSALRSLGWKPHEVKAAVEAARTHVGNADLPVDEWIRIALGKCPLSK